MKPRVLVLSLMGCFCAPLWSEEVSANSAVNPSLQVGREVPLRRISARLAAEIRRGLPAFDPTVVREEQISEAVAQGALVLPTLTVRERKAPVLNQDNVLTSTGLADELVRRFPGMMRAGQDPTDSRKINYAVLMYRDIERLRGMKAADDFAKKLEGIGRGEESEKLKQENYRTFVRTPNWLTETMDKSVNSWRR